MTLDAISARTSASSIAESPPPTTPTTSSAKNAPSQVAQYGHSRALQVGLAGNVQRLQRRSAGDYDSARRQLAVVRLDRPPAISLSETDHLREPYIGAVLGRLVEYQPSDVAAGYPVGGSPESFDPGRR